MAGKMTTRRTGKNGKKEDAERGKEMGIAEFVLEGELDDDLPELGQKADSDEEEDDSVETTVVAAAKDDVGKFGGDARVSKAAECARKFFRV
jgi:hypothetical protein